MNKPILVIGAGGHAAVLIEMLRQNNFEIVGVVAATPPESHPIFKEIPYFSKDEDVLQFNVNDVLLVNGIGSLPGKTLRFSIQQNFEKQGYKFLTIVSDKAILSSYCELAEGVQVMPGAIINCKSKIGKGSIINSGAIVEHDCIIGEYNHIAPGVTLSGGVTTREFVHIGTGAKVIQGISIGANVMVGAGATVTADIDDNKKLYVAKPYLA